MNADECDGIEQRIAGELEVLRDRLDQYGRPQAGEVLSVVEELLRVLDVRHRIRRRLHQLSEDEAEWITKYWRIDVRSLATPCSGLTRMTGWCQAAALNRSCALMP